MEILFHAGQPVGGKVSNFLLEKSRVVKQNSLERNFHIFYQIISGFQHAEKSYYGITDPEDYNYLNEYGCYKVNTYVLLKALLFPCTCGTAADVKIELYGK